MVFQLKTQNPSLIAVSWQDHVQSLSMLIPPKATHADLVEMYTQNAKKGAGGERGRECNFRIGIPLVQGKKKI